MPEPTVGRLQAPDDLRMALCGPDQPVDREPHLFCPDNPPNEFQRGMGSYCCTGLSHRVGEQRIVCTHECHHYKPPLPVSDLANGIGRALFGPGGPLDPVYRPSASDRMGGV